MKNDFLLQLRNINPLLPVRNSPALSMPTRILPPVRHRWINFRLRRDMVMPQSRRTIFTTAYPEKRLLLSAAIMPRMVQTAVWMVF